MSDITLAQLVHKALQEAGYTPVSGQEPGFIVASEKGGGIIISYSLTNDLQHIQAYQAIPKERTSLRRCLTPTAMRFFNKSVMVMGPSQHSILLRHLLPVSVSWRKCLIPVKSALSKSVFEEDHYAVLQQEGPGYGTLVTLCVAISRTT